MKHSYLEKQFLNFHSHNPAVYHIFDRFAREAIRAGRVVLSAKLIFERIRWETQVITTDSDSYKLNNNYHAYYARLWMDNNRDSEATFRTRQVYGEKYAA